MSTSQVRKQGAAQEEVEGERDIDCELAREFEADLGANPLVDPAAALREWELAVKEITGRLLDEPDDPGQYGIYLYTAESAPEDQVSAFHWFESRSDLLDFVRTVLPMNARHFHQGDPFALRERVCSVMDRMEHREIETAEAIDGVNALLGDACSIEWWGRALDLMASPNEFARSLRLWYREARDEREEIGMDSGEDPITADEFEDFRAMLGEYR